MMGAGQKVLLISGTRASTGDQCLLKGAWMPESVSAISGCTKLGGGNLSRHQWCMLCGLAWPGFGMVWYGGCVALT